MTTRERILDSALRLLNETSAATVTTNAIADETDISVGNLYYHFNNKATILLALLRRFQQSVAPLLNAEQSLLSMADWVDWWQQWFDEVEAYSFLFHNQQYLLHLDSHLRFHYQQLVSRLGALQQRQLLALKAQDELVATAADIDRLAREVTFIAIFWHDFIALEGLLQPTNGQSARSALRQVLGLLLPYMKVSEQLSTEQLISRYEPALIDHLGSVGIG